MITPSPAIVPADYLVNEYVTLDAIMLGPDFGRGRNRQRKWYARIRYDDNAVSQVSVFGDQLTILKAAGFRIAEWYEASASQWQLVARPMTVLVKGERNLIRIRAAQHNTVCRWATWREWKAVHVSDILYTSQENLFEKVIALRWETDSAKIATVNDGTYEYERRIENNRDGYVVISTEI